MGKGRVTINGKNYDVPDGSSVSVIGNKVYVDGKEYNSSEKNSSKLEIHWEGEPPKSLTVRGDNVRVKCGNIAGDVTSEGSIDCEEVSGNVKADGSIVCGNVGGYARAGGSVSCKNVNGDASAGGSVNCKDITGNVNAGGSINAKKIIK
tara:strand:+ start:93 stop:539 length:447 start_codon:yes stop_codon:yes gene_type:complete